MITRIDLRHFKCFGTLKLPLRALTVLSGTNASGKSSVLQALVLLHQTMREHEWSKSLLLNGNFVQLGTAADVIDQVEGRKSCCIRLHDGDTEYSWTFAREHREMSLAVEKVFIDERECHGAHHSEALQYLLPLNITDERHNNFTLRMRRLSYLTAERIGPREVYPLEHFESSPVVGAKGEHTVSVLVSLSDELVLEKLALEGIPRACLRQVEARMGRFFPGFELSVSPITLANAVTLGLRTSKSTEHHRPINTGFGLTQVLPIVVAALCTKACDLLLIENPEVHLHPSGQALMGEFLAEVAASGVQVMLETHSDHVLNGIRRAVKGGILSSDDAALHFFSPRIENSLEGPPQVQSPLLDSNGNIDSWPEGFFDQFDRDMNYFAGWD